LEFFEKAIKRIGLDVVLMEQENWDRVNVNQVIANGIRHGSLN
jgi:aspartate/glutamate racemase